jgi:hypothetical protein
MLHHRALSSLPALLAFAALTHAAPAQAVEPDGTVVIERIFANDTAVHSAALSEVFEGVGFVATYDVICDNKKDEHEFRVVDKGWLFRMDKGRVLKVRGASDMDDKLKKDWWCGDKVPANKVELRFDGDRLRMNING